ncbi:MAG: PEP-CTERM sorting domain-containing protein [Akkermansiaceae bacterium]
MKLKSTLVAAFSFAAMATSQAFVIDFNALIPTGAFSVGDTITSGSSLDVYVDGYGYVTFQNDSTASATADGDLVIGTTYSDGAGSINSLEMETGETVTVIFKGAPVTDVQAGFAGVSADPFDTGIFEKVVEGQEYTAVSIDSSYFPGGEYQGADGVGLEYVQWNIVPEPSSAALGAIGLSMILFRRRNA